MIYDNDGMAKKTAGLSYKDETITITKDNDNVEEYTSVLIPGFANKPSNIKISMTEKTYFTKFSNMNVKYNNEKSLKMYPNINYTLNCEFEKPELNVPDKQNYFSELTFISKKTKDVEFTKILNINN